MSRNKAMTQVQSHFADAVHADIQRSVIMRNSSKKTTFNAGDLVPIYIDEVIPGDTFEMDMAFVSRLTTPIFPTMDTLNLDFYAFFVPNRIVWDGWEELMGENKTGAWIPPTPPALIPKFNQGQIIEKTLGDYYGLPIDLPLTFYPVNSLPFRGYNLIWNEWFRDQNTQAPKILNTGNTETLIDYMPTSGLYRVNKKHDYFTSCLPAPQKNDSPIIPLELSELLPVITGLPREGEVGVGMQFNKQNGDSFGAGNFYLKGLAGALFYSEEASGGNNGTFAKPNNLYADTRGILNSTTISELRTAFQIQKLYERDARGGTRYVEMLKAHFGVDAQDYRLQRPEFLGHMHSMVGVQQVAQTSSTDNTSPQGNLAAFSHTAGRSTLFKKSFVEHGYIHIFAVARQPKTYQQGIEKFWSYSDRLDHYLPVLSHISEQPVYVKEIYANVPTNQGNEVFGYNEAWAHLRYKPNQVTGQFRSGVPNSLDNWHYADYYASRPALNSDFIQDNSKVNVDRTIAVQSSLHDQIIIDIAFICKATRPMPVNSIPGFVDHF